MSAEPAPGLPRTVLGIAIEVPDPLGTLLTEWRIKVGDPLGHLIPPHVTLLPPTEVAGVASREVHEHLASVGARHPPFQLHLTGTGSFRPVSQVVFVTVADGISACELLADDVRSGLLSRPLVYPYHPHVTIAHDVPPDMLDVAYDGLADVDERVEVDSFCAFEQSSAGRWMPVRRYALHGAVGAVGG